MLESEPEVRLNSKEITSSLFSLQKIFVCNLKQTEQRRKVKKCII